MTTVRTVVFDEPGPANVLHVAEVLLEPLGSRDIRIRAAGAGINRAEVLQRRGGYPIPKGASPHLGLEVAGVVAEIGKDVTKWQGGERVAALADGGAYADLVAVREDQALLIPDNWSDAEAAGFVETTLTAYLNIFEFGGLNGVQAGTTKQGAVLLHGGGSGVGTQGIKLSKAKGLKVFVTAGSDQKCRQSLEVGADHAINYKTQRFEEEVLKLTDQKGVDVILDNIGGPYLQRDITCLAADGHIVFIGTMGGTDVESLDMRSIMAKRAQIIGSTLRPRSLDFKARIIADLQEYFQEQIADGTLKPVIYKTFPLEQAADAHKCMESNEHFGKIVLLTQTGK